MPQNFHHVGITFDVTGQVLEFYPGQAEVVPDGAPTAAATYRVFGGTQSMEDTPILAGTATLSAVSTTINAASGLGQTNPRRAFVAATTSMTVGEFLLLTNAAGQREIAEVAAVNGSTSFDAVSQLEYAYASGATVKGLRQYFTIDADFIADESRINMYGVSQVLGRLTGNGVSGSTLAPPYRIEWAYTTGSTPRRSWTFFDVARAPAKPLVSLSDLKELYPDVNLVEWAETRGQDFAGQLRAAERDLRLDVRTSGYDPNTIQDPEGYQRLLLAKWAVVIGGGMLMTQPNLGVWAAKVESDYTKLFERLVGTTFRVWSAMGSSGAITPEPPKQLWFGSR